MYIIAGKYKGRVLETMPDRNVRPVTNRVKGTIFNMLQNRLNLNGAKVLDLFAGSGSLGLEAISRGAARSVFVDTADVAYKAIKANVNALGCESACLIVLMDAIKFIENTNEQFDLIFADPPYVYEKTAQVPRLIFNRKLLKKKGFLIIEHSKQTIFEPNTSFLLMRQKEFGSTRISFFTHPYEKGLLE